jgi:putative alpha-1,2-mannosidase
MTKCLDLCKDENDRRITGYRQTNGWARTRTVYFAMEFSKPFKSYGQKNFDSNKLIEVLEKMESG